MQSMRMYVAFMTHFVVKVMQLYLWPEIQQIIILMDLRFYTVEVVVMEKYYLEIRIVNSSFHKYLEKT